MVQVPFHLLLNVLLHLPQNSHSKGALTKWKSCYRKVLGRRLRSSKALPANINYEFNSTTKKEREQKKWLIMNRQQTSMNSSRDRTSPTSALVAKITYTWAKLTGKKNLPESVIFSGYWENFLKFWTVKKKTHTSSLSSKCTSTSKLKNSSSFKVIFQIPLVSARYTRIPAWLLKPWEDLKKTTLPKLTSYCCDPSTQACIESKCEKCNVMAILNDWESDESEEFSSEEDETPSTFTYKAWIRENNKIQKTTVTKNRLDELYHGWEISVLALKKHIYGKREQVIIINLFNMKSWLASSFILLLITVLIF